MMNPTAVRNGNDKTPSASSLGGGGFLRALCPVHGAAPLAGCDACEKSAREYDRRDVRSYTTK